MSGAGIMSGLATAGGIIGGGATVGVFVLAAPVAILACGGVALASKLKHKQLMQEKERLYHVAIQRHQGIINALKSEVNATKERIEYLNKLNIILQAAINDLKSDMEIDK